MTKLKLTYGLYAIPNNESGEAVEDPKEMPYLTTNPHYYLEHGEKWFEQLKDEGLAEVEIRTDFKIPYGEMYLVLPNGIEKVFELKDDKL